MPPEEQEGAKENSNIGNMTSKDSQKATPLEAFRTIGESNI